MDYSLQGYTWTERTTKIGQNQIHSEEYKIFLRTLPFVKKGNPTNWILTLSKATYIDSNGTHGVPQIGITKKEALDATPQHAYNYSMPPEERNILSIIRPECRGQISAPDGFENEKFYRCASFGWNIEKQEIWLDQTHFES